jgi:hypothetical protein
VPPFLSLPLPPPLHITHLHAQMHTHTHTHTHKHIYIYNYIYVYIYNIYIYSAPLPPSPSLGGQWSPSRAQQHGLMLSTHTTREPIPKENLAVVLDQEGLNQTFSKGTF